MFFHEFYHLRHCLRGQNWKQVGDQQELVSLAICSILWLEAAESNTLAIIGASPSSVDKWRVESMNIEVGSINKETFSHGAIAIQIGGNVKPEIVIDVQPLGQ